MSAALLPLAPMPPELVAALAPIKTTARPNGKLRPFRGTLTPYAEAALEREAQAVATCPAGAGRHVRLYAAAAALGELIAGGMLPRAMGEDRLREACSANGMQDEDRGDEIERTISDGIGQGMLSPRGEPTPAWESRPRVTEWESRPEVTSWKS